MTDIGDYVVKETITATTDQGGDATAYSGAVSGRVISIAYAKDDYADGVDFTITTETTGQNLWVDTNVNASETVAPRQATHATDGSASLYAAAGEPVEDYIWAVDERIKVVVASGGDTKSGAFTVIVG